MNNNLILTPIFVCLSIAFTACKKEQKVDLNPAQQKLIQLQNEISELTDERNRLDEIYNATLRRIKQLESVRELAEKRESERVENDKIEIDAIYKKRLSFIKKDRKIAWQSYVGKSYPEINLIDGTSYDNVTITDVDINGIGFRHTIGAARIDYDKISPEHRELLKNCYKIPTQQIADLEADLEEEKRARKELPNKALEEQY